MTDTLGLMHRYVAASDGDTTLLMLHGTGGDENDLLPLGRWLLPGAGLLSPRGAVLERGMPRFFRRISEGVYDVDDLARRTDDLAAFIDEAAAHHAFDRSKVIAVGFSNGANIAASLLLRRPNALRGAVLLSPMWPFEPAEAPSLAGTGVFVGAGKNDPIAMPEHADRLVDALRAAGADVELYWHDGGHTIVNDELEAARAWISR